MVDRNNYVCSGTSKRRQDSIKLSEPVKRHIKLSDDLIHLKGPYKRGACT